MRTRFFTRIFLWMSLAATLLLWPGDALAQRGRGGHGGGGRTASGRAVPGVRFIRPARFTRVPTTVRTYYHSYYRPYYYPRYFYSSFYWGWGGFGYYPYWWLPRGYYPYGGYYRPWYDDLGALRVEVKPRDAQVYVDGYFAGLVDDFDGISQRLRAKPGEHQIDVYMPGFQTFSEKMLFRPGQHAEDQEHAAAAGRGRGAAGEAGAHGAASDAAGPSQYAIRAGASADCRVRRIAGAARSRGRARARRSGRPGPAGAVGLRDALDSRLSRVMRSC